MTAWHFNSKGVTVIKIGICFWCCTQWIYPQIRPPWRNWFKSDNTSLAMTVNIKSLLPPFLHAFFVVEVFIDLLPVWRIR